MLFLYDEKPVSIFMSGDDTRISVDFCNIKMKMKPCQFRLFHNYLFNTSKKLIENTNTVDLVLVTNSLKVTISTPHFFHLFSAVEIVMNKKFGNQLIYKN